LRFAAEFVDAAVGMGVDDYPVSGITLRRRRIDVALLGGQQQHHWSWDFMPTVADLYQEFLEKQVVP
jgi:hypothetical protein